MSGEFVDTNVLVYAHDHSAGAKRHRAAELIIRLGRERTGIISVQVLMELLATLTRKLNRPLPLATAAEIVDDLVSWRVPGGVTWVSRCHGRAARKGSHYRDHRTFQCALLWFGVPNEVVRRRPS